MTAGGVPALSDALAATDGSRVMIDLPGTPDRPRGVYDNGRQFYLGARFRF